MELFKDIINCKLQVPDEVSTDLKDLFSKIFVADPDKRLGGGPGGAREIMNHPWFAGINWNKMLKKQYVPPFKPNLRSPTDPRYVA